MNPGERMKLSVLVPVYNESRTLKEMLRQLLQLPVDQEILVVDDGSTDGTWEILETIKDPRVRRFRHDRNRGKGAALRTAIPQALGDYVIVQDGDLEYDPRDILRLLRVAEEHEAPVVYGNRVHGRFRKSYQRYYWGGRLITLVTNLLFRTGIQDEPVCYKLLRRDLLQSLPLKCQKFEFCPEVTALIALRGHRILEVPISYSPRGFAEGKKIGWKDGLQAIWVLIRLRLSATARD
jgi:dolichol-phosphate mannosyltransferase